MSPPLGSYLSTHWNIANSTFLGPQPVDAVQRQAVPAHTERRVVSVLFADLVGFTAAASRVTPAVLVNNLNRIFSAFDDLCRRLQIEKIKTNGDAYMAAAGLPLPRPDHAEVIRGTLRLDMTRFHGRG